MIDLASPVLPNPAWHDELFRGWRRDYPDPMPSPAVAPPPEDGLLFRARPLHLEDEEATAPLLPGARESGGGSGAYDDIAHARALDPENLRGPVTAFGNWRGPVTGLDWMQLTPLGLGGRVALGFLGALTGRTLPGSPQATQRAWDLRALRADIEDILAGAVAKGRWAGSAPLDPRQAGVSRRNNPYDISRFAGADGHGGAPDAGGFGGGFDPDTGMGPGPHGEPW